MMCLLGCKCRYLVTIAFIFLLQAYAGVRLHAQSPNFFQRFLMQADSLNHATIDSNYIRLPKTDWTLRPYLMYKFISTAVDWKDSSNAQHNIGYRPNRPLQLGLLAGFQRFGVALAVSIPYTAQDEKRFGKTRSFDGQVYMYGRKWATDITYAQYDGLYVSTPKIIDPNWKQETPFPQRQDLGLKFINANLHYVFNSRRFSFRATTQQLEEQRKSAGSFMLLGGFNWFQPKGEAPWIPETAPAVAHTYMQFQDARLMSISLAPGYGYAVRGGRWVATPMLFLGPTFQRGYLTTQARDRVFIAERVGFRFQFQGTLVYFGEHFFAGSQVRFDEFKYRKQDLSISATQFNFRLFAGWRWQKSPWVRYRLGAAKGRFMNRHPLREP